MIPLSFQTLWQQGLDTALFSLKLCGAGGGGFILGCTQAAIQAKTHMVDLGGHTETVLKQLAMDARAKEAGIAVVPDCGMGPGMNNTLGIYTVEQLAARGAVPAAAPPG